MYENIIGKRNYKLYYKGFMNEMQEKTVNKLHACFFTKPLVQKAKDYLDANPIMKRAAFVGGIMVTGIAFNTTFHLFGAETAYAAEVVPMADADAVEGNQEVETVQLANVETLNNSELTETNAETLNNSEALKTETTSEYLKQTEVVETETTSEDLKQTEAEETQTTEVNDNDTTKETKESTKSTSQKEVEQQISEESKNGHYLEPTYAVNGVDISDAADTQGKVVFNGDQTNCIILTDKDGNTKIWTLDSYGFANHGVASNQDTLINNLKNSPLTNLSQDGNHKLVWPGFDYTDPETGLSHCSFDGGEIIYDSKTKEYTVLYDKSMYTSTMGVETSEKYHIDPDKVEPSKPIEEKTPVPDPKPTPDPKPVKTGDNLDFSNITKSGILGIAGGALAGLGYKLKKYGQDPEISSLTKLLMANMDEEMANGYVKKYGKRL